MRFKNITLNDGYQTLIAVPSTKLEQKILKVFKYDLIDENELLCDWHPEWLGEENALKYMRALGYTSVYYNGPGARLTQEFEGEEYVITATPSNLKVIIAGYRLLGKHRKVAQILKDLKRVDYYNN